MKEFLENPKLLVDEFNDLIAVSQSKAFITVGIEIQKEEIVVLKNYRDELIALKQQFVNKQDEKGANIVYCIEASIRTIQYELEMLVNIKEDKMSIAWENLVDAQNTYGTVLRNLPYHADFFDNYIERLKNYEKLLFPKLFFQSIGGIVKESHCSICKLDFNDCDHIRGRLYNGELCTRMVTEIDLEEVSFVDNPANKRCRVLTIQTNGKTFDVMTLREEKNEIVHP
jgi:hypothetical protein